jgi:hypothetical protein
MPAEKLNVKLFNPYKKIMHTPDQEKMVKNFCHVLGEKKH